MRPAMASLPSSYLVAGLLGRPGAAKAMARTDAAPADAATAGSSGGAGSGEGGQWYFSREHIEKHSPSRADGIDLRRETYLRRSYCTFLQDLGMRLRVYALTPHPTPAPHALPPRLVPFHRASCPSPAPHALPPRLMPFPRASCPSTAPHALPPRLVPFHRASCPSPAPHALPPRLMPFHRASCPSPAPHAAADNDSDGHRVLPSLLHAPVARQERPLCDSDGVHVPGGQGGGDAARAQGGGAEEPRRAGPEGPRRRCQAAPQGGAAEGGGAGGRGARAGDAGLRPERGARLQAPRGRRQALQGRPAGPRPGRLELHQRRAAHVAVSAGARGAVRGGRHQPGGQVPASQAARRQRLTLVGRLQRLAQTAPR
ncbi:unnamed protein product, partial [Closterium sp. Naga37s-1]